MEQSTALQPAPQQSKLLELMAQQYKLDGQAFKNVLLKTVFPQDKPVTLEQLANFCAVAHEYKLNPLIREIFAFPSKSGGIIPIVSIDGWITMVQRHPQYDGHSFVHEWKDGKVGGQLVSMTCLMRRKDREHPIENTEFMEECRRDTDPWKKWPSRMLRHKCFIQSARYAFGLSGIYDEDEAERIIESELVITSAKPSIQMPQRMQQIEAKTVSQNPPESSIVEQVEQRQEAVGAAVQDALLEGPRDNGPMDGVQEVSGEVYPTYAETGEKEGERTIFAGLTDPVPEAQPEPEPEKPRGTWDRVNTLGRGKAQRIYTILNRHKKHTQAELDAVWLKPRRLDHLSDLPLELNDAVAKWAEGLE